MFSPASRRHEETNETGVFRSGQRTTMCDTLTESDSTLSLHEEALKEAERHKWIESQKIGRDLGRAALLEWYRIHWPHYCRIKRLEHLQGRRRWLEFDDDHFGQLYMLILEGDLLVDRVLDRFYAGMENLDIICWSFEWGLSVERVVDLLIQLDMNRARLEPVGVE